MPADTQTIRAVAKEAFLYGFPMVEAYKTASRVETEWCEEVRLWMLASGTSPHWTISATG
jgi:hypothetical protein